MRDSVEKIENLWHSKDDRQPFSRDKVHDIAEALLRQKALDRNRHGIEANSLGNSQNENDLPLIVRIKKLAARMSRDHVLPVKLDQDVMDAYELKETMADWGRFTNQQIGELQEAFAKFVMNSFFERGYGVVDLGADNNGQSSGFRTNLVRQYRMRSEIADIVSGSVYDGQYETALSAEGENLIPNIRFGNFDKPVHFVDTFLLGALATSTQMGNGWANAAEALHVIEILRTISTDTNSAGLLSVMVLSPYKKQIQLIEGMLAEQFSHDSGEIAIPRISDLKLTSIDGAQGGEADIVIISFARASVTGLPSAGEAMFLQDMRRLNVAITRARSKVIFIGHAPTIENLCGDNRASSFLSALFLPETGIERGMPFRIPAVQLEAAKERLDTLSSLALAEDSPVETEVL